MTFLEICQMVLDEGDRTASQLNDVVLKPDMDEMERKVIRWVKQAYLRIQRKSEFWNFHLVEGTLVTTLDDGTNDYVLTSLSPNVRTIVKDSLSARVTSTTYEWPVIYLTYQQWRDMFQIASATLADGSPVYFIELPSGSVRIEPGPNQVFEVLGSWYRTLHHFVDQDDEPLWHIDYHEIIAWEALRSFASEYEVSDEIGERAKTYLPALWGAFNRKYLPELEGGY